MQKSFGERALRSHILILLPLEAKAAAAFTNSAGIDQATPVLCPVIQSHLRIRTGKLKSKEIHDL